MEGAVARAAEWYYLRRTRCGTVGTAHIAPPLPNEEWVPLWDPFLFLPFRQGWFLRSRFISRPAQPRGPFCPRYQENKPGLSLWWLSVCLRIYLD